MADRGRGRETAPVGERPEMRETPQDSAQLAACDERAEQWEQWGRRLSELRRQVEELEMLAREREAIEGEVGLAGDDVTLEKAGERTMVRPGRSQSLAGQRQPVTERGNMWEGVL